MHFASADQLATWFQHNWTIGPKWIDWREPLEFTKLNSEKWSRKPEKKNPSKSRKIENISLQERLADLQEVQMKALEEAQKRKQDFMKTMLEEQRQMDAAEREKNRQFLLQLGNLFAQK